MQFIRYLLAAGSTAGLILLGGLQAAAATVEVTFVQPESYSDGSLYGYGRKADDPALHEIRTHLERLGARYLKPGQRLTVEVLDLDLAGRFEPWHPFANDIRILRGITWPRIKLRYSLYENGDVTKHAEETVSDLNYLMDISARYTSTRLPYEKTMLEGWFRARFTSRGLPPA